MSLLSLASAESIWRGYEYYKNGEVISSEYISDTEFSGKVSGSGKNIYDVHINTEHARKSGCNCPYANGKRIICKHQIALFFTIFPFEAERYYHDVVEYREEEERLEEEKEQKVIDYVSKMKKDELQQALLELLFDGPEWQYDRFVQWHID